MTASKELFAFCGFYCGDCLGYTGVIADGAEAFKVVLDRYQFGRTAKAVFPRELAEYARFYEMLEFMTTLRCPGICRNPVADPDASTCAVKKCCLDKGIYACYECDAFETCETLNSLHEGLHTEPCLKNLRAIRQMGLEAWLAEQEERVRRGVVYADFRYNVEEEE